MTTKEIFEKYLILFKITVSQAGEETNNPVYKNVYNIFFSHPKLFLFMLLFILNNHQKYFVNIIIFILR